MTITVSPSSGRNTHHVKLSRSGVEVGLILCDGQGNANERGIDRSPYPRSALKMYSGEQKYSDMEPPFMPIVQQDWNGGRGLELFEDDKTRYYDGYRANTQHRGKIFLGGQETYATGYRNLNQHMPGSMSWQGLYGTERYLATSFVASASYNADKLELWVRKVGTPTGSLTAGLYTDSSGSPGLLLASQTVSVSGVDAILSALAAFNWAGTQALANGSTYWVVVYGPAGDGATNHWEVGIDVSSTGKKSSDGSAWNAWTDGLYYRVTDTDAPFVALFFEYKGQLYFVTRPDAGGNGSIYINGYRGVADSNSGDLTRLNDATQTGWSTSALSGAIAAIYDGQGVTEERNWRAITGAGSGYADVTPPWNLTHVASGADPTLYNILGLNSWVSLGTTPKPAQDVATTGEVIWIAQGEEVGSRARNLVLLRYYADILGNWVSEGGVEKQQQASFLKAILDPVVGYLLYLGKNNDADGDTTVTRIVAPQDIEYGGLLQGAAYHSVSPNGFMTELMDTITDYASDSFNRVNAASLGSTDGAGDPNHTGGSGLAWADSVGSWEIISNAASPDTLTGGKAVATVDTTHTDVLAVAAVTRSGGAPGVVVRYVDADNYVKVVHNGTNLQLIKRLAGIETTVYETAVTYIAGARVKARTAGTRFQLWYNDLQVGGNYTISDAALQTGTRVGLYSENLADTFDYFYCYSNQLIVTNRGTNNCKIEIAPEFATGLIATDLVSYTGEDWRGFEQIKMNIRSTKALAAGDLQLKIDDSLLCASPISSTNFGSLEADVYYSDFYSSRSPDITFDLSAVAGADAVKSVGLFLASNPTEPFEIYVNFQWLATNEKRIQVGDRSERITGLERYGDPETLWVFKEGSIWEVTNGIAHALPLRAMESVRSGDNGKGHVVHDVYLFFSLGQGLERYYRQNLDDIGPNRDAGLPDDRQGNIVHAVDYPSGFFAAVDGGSSNYSSVLFYSENGWHEVYRAPRRGLRIRRIHIQPIPGSPVARLWISQGADILWIPVALNPLATASYRYTHEAALTTGRVTAGMQDVLKFYKSVKLATKSLTTSGVDITVQYQLDGSSTWTTITDTFDTSPSQEIDISSSNNVSGKWVQLRLILRTTDNTVTPEVYATVIESLMRIPVKYAYSLTFRVADSDVDLLGDPDTVGAKAKIDQLDSWIASAVPITLNSISNLYDGKTVFPEPTPVKLLRTVQDEAGREVMVCQCTLIEI